MYFRRYSTKLPLPLESTWEFFSTPKNVKILTPEFLGWEILNEEEDEKMYPGQVISYYIRPFWNIRFHWVAEITHIQKPNYFIDVQRFGPYKYWHHEHRFQEIPNGVEIIDSIYYQLPYGVLGKAFHALKVKKDLDKIFTYRRHNLEKLFGTYPG